MTTARHDEFGWSRVLLAVMSVGFLAVAAFSLFASFFAFEPEDRVPEVTILAPAGIAVCAFVLASIGGRVASAVSGILGACVAAAAAWLLADAGPSEWFTSRSAAVFFLALLGATAAGVAAVPLAVRDLRLAREEAKRIGASADESHRTRLVDRIKKVVSWSVVCALVAIAAGTGWWWYRSAVLAPPCGPVAETQLRAALQDLTLRIPGLRFTDAEVSCAAANEAYASWEHDDPQELAKDARAAGCVVSESTDYLEDEDAFITCSTSGRRMAFGLDPSRSAPMAGQVALN